MSPVKEGQSGVSTRSRTIMAVLWLGVGACNWTKFSDDADRAPVRSIGSPSGFDSSDFGKSLLPLSGGQGSAAAFIATGFNGSHLALVKVDDHGGVTSAAVSTTAFTDTESSAVTSVAEIAGSSPTLLLLGTPTVRDKDFGRVYTYQLPGPAVAGLGDGAVTTLHSKLGEMDSGLGRGLATGFVGGVAGTADLIIGGDNDLAVVVDGNPEMTAVATVPVPGPDGDCEVAYEHLQDPRYLARRPLATARLWADPAGVQQILVGSTHAGTPGKVGIMALGPGGTTLSCLASITGTQPKFGHAFAVGDFDGDGADDLAISAPPKQVLVYLGWSKLPIGTVPAPLAPVVSNTGVDFGFSITALNVDGLPGDELLISDPRATVGGQANAGQVLGFKYDPASATMVSLAAPLAEFSDHAPESDAAFGYTVNGLNFCRTDPASLAGGPCPISDLSRILLVGASNEVFVYFRVGSNIPMPTGATAPDVRTP